MIFGCDALSLLLKGSLLGFRFCEMKPEVTGEIAENRSHYQSASLIAAIIGIAFQG
jgi:hypothetical protein